MVFFPRLKTDGSAKTSVWNVDSNNDASNILNVEEEKVNFIKVCELSNVMMHFNQTTHFILRYPDLLPLRDLFRNTPVNMTNLDEGEILLLQSFIWRLSIIFSDEEN